MFQGLLKRRLICYQAWDKRPPCITCVGVSASWRLPLPRSLTCSPCALLEACWGGCWHLLVLSPLLPTLCGPLVSDPSRLTSSCGLRPCWIISGPWAHFSFFCPEFRLVGFHFGNSGLFFVRAVILIFFSLLTSLSHFVLEVILTCSTTHRDLEKSKWIFKPHGAL